MTRAVGFFDGVHLGHREVLAGAEKVTTFDPHPRQVLAPGNAPKLIMSLSDRVRALRANGAREVEVIPFTAALAERSPEAFAAQCFAADDVIRCTANWHFGRGGQGSAETLLRLGYSVEVVPMAHYKGENISSTRIRAAITEGAMEEVRAMLGRPLSRVGIHFRGKGLGGRLGFPTMNLHLDGTEKLVQPPAGVYVVVAHGSRGVANFGFAPTLGARAWISPTLEIHFLNNIPPKAETEALRVDFLSFLRPERRFDTIESLVRQIREDVARAANTAR